MSETSGPADPTTSPTAPRADAEHVALASQLRDVGQRLSALRVELGPRERPDAERVLELCTELLAAHPDADPAGTVERQHAEDPEPDEPGQERRPKTVQRIPRDHMMPKPIRRELLGLVERLGRRSSVAVPFASLARAMNALAAGHAQVTREALSLADEALVFRGY